MNISNLISNFFNLLGSVASRIYSTLTGLIAGVVRGIGSAFTGAFNIALRAVTLGLGVVAGGLVGLGASLKLAAEKALEFGKSALTLRSNTGMSLGAAGGLLLRGTAFGMSSGQTTSAFSSNPLMGMFGMGSKPSDPHFFSKLANQYNGYLSGGPLGAMMGKAMLGAQFGPGGMPPEVQNIASMNPKLVREQEDWVNRLQRNLGLSSESIARWSERIPLLTARINTLVQVGFLRLADAIGPSVVSGLEKITEFFTRNADRIAPIAERIVRALSEVVVSGLEKALAFLEAHEGQIEGWIQNAFDWLFNRFPQLLLQTGALILRGIGSILEGLGNLALQLDALLPSISQFIANVTTSFVQHLPEIAAAFDQGFNLFRDFTLQVVDTVEQLVKQARQALGLNNDGSGQGPNGGQPGMPNGALGRGVNALGRTARNIVQNTTGIGVGDPNDGSLFQNLMNSGVGLLAAPKVLGWGARLLGLGGGASGGGGIVGRGASYLGRTLANSTFGRGMALVGQNLLQGWAYPTGGALTGVTLPGIAAAAGSVGPWGIGTALGIAGYEGLRKLGDSGTRGFGYFKDMPSTWGILKHYGLGLNPYGEESAAPSGRAPSRRAGRSGVGSSSGASGHPRGGVAAMLADLIPSSNLANNPDFLRIARSGAIDFNTFSQQMLGGAHQNLLRVAGGAFGMAGAANMGAGTLEAMLQELRTLNGHASETARTNGRMERYARSDDYSRGFRDGLAAQNTLNTIIGNAARDTALGIASGGF